MKHTLAVGTYACTKDTSCLFQVHSFEYIVQPITKEKLAGLENPDTLTFRHM